MYTVQACNFAEFFLLSAQLHISLFQRIFPAHAGTQNMLHKYTYKKNKDKKPKENKQTNRN